jgi:hypothetical protein
MTSFLGAIEGLADNMGQAAAHIGACLKKTEPTHQAFGVLHRLERCFYDVSKQIESILDQASPEVREKLANIE